LFTEWTPHRRGAVLVEVNDIAARLLRRYWLLLLVAAIVPMVAVGAFALQQHATYTAHARILAGASIPRAQAEASALVSQVQAIATSRDVVATALRDSRLDRDPDKVLDKIVVTGLGSSAVVDLAYTDADPQVAMTATEALAKAVTTQLDATRIGSLPEVLKNVDNQLTDLATKRAPIAAEAQANPKDPVAQNRLAGIDRLISDLAGDRNRLSESAAAAGHATVVAMPTKPTQADSKGVPAKLALGVIFGLAMGLVIAGINETLRPAVSGASRVSRLLEVPLLGALRPDPVALADVGRRMRLAAGRANISTIVLVRATRGSLAPELVDRVEAATLRPNAVAGRISIPIESRNGAGDHHDRMGLSSLRGNDATVDGKSAVAVMTTTEKSGRTVRLRRVCALDELDPAAETEQIGLVVLASPRTRLTAVDSVRDLLDASGWPLLGVLGDVNDKAGRGFGA
jgi:capsular polysaccharide biosynthesis protein